LFGAVGRLRAFGKRREVEALRLDASLSTMDEVCTQNSPPSDSFFAGPDEEGDAAMAIDDTDARSSPSVPQTPKTFSSHSSPPQEKLFLDDSDDEVVITEDFPTLKRSQAVMMEDTSDVEIVEQTRKADFDPRTSRSNLHATISVSRPSGR
jgi:hypothetical protein